MVVAAEVLGGEETVVAGGDKVAGHVEGVGGTICESDGPQGHAEGGDRGRAICSVDGAPVAEEGLGVREEIVGAESDGETATGVKDDGDGVSRGCNGRQGGQKG